MNEETRVDFTSSGYQIQSEKLSYVGHEVTRIPDVFGKLHGHHVKYLDLSHNHITNVLGVEKFLNLTVLILDNNEISDSIIFPSIRTLETLSLNNNKIHDLEQFVKKVKYNLPNLTFLSLLGNKACPNQLSDANKDEEDYQRYRYFVLHHLRNLKFLDSSKVTAAELQLAMTKGHLMQIKRPKVDRRRETQDDRFKFTPLPPPSRPIGDHKGAYGVFRFRYSTKESEGNRFIMNNDL